MLNRRELALGLTGTLGSLMLPMRAAPQDSTYDSFHKNLLKRPWLKLYTGVQDEDTGTTQCQVEGNWPTDLVGALYRNGPGRMERDGRRYQHWFDGDGLVQKWSIGPNGEVTHRARLVHTDKYLHDEAQNELSLVGFGTMGDDSVSISSPDSLNVGNISVLPRDDEIWALWEGGSAWRMEIDSLSTKGIVELSTESSGLPFSAHPRVEPKGTLWNFGYVSHLGALVIWRLDPGKKEPTITVIPRTPMTIPHDFVVTEKHLVLPLPPFHYEPDPDVEHSFLDAHVWHPERSLDVLIMNKNNPSDNFVVELAANWYFHYSNAWEDRDGVIRFEGMRYDDPSLMYDAFKNVMRGDPPTNLSLSDLVQFRIDTRTRKGGVEPFDNDLLACEFPRIDQRRSTMRHEWVTMLGSNSQSPALKFGLLNSVVRVNTSSGAVNGFTYPDQEIPEEHLFIPNPNGNRETDGWLLGTSLDYITEETHLNVFKIGRAAPELLARATLTRLMPLGLHGQFVSES